MGYLSQKNYVADIIPLNTGSTLSPFSSPGENKRFPITNSESVFTFGDFKLQRPNVFDNLELSSSAISFSQFSTLDSFSSTTIEPEKVLSTASNELNPDVTNPNSYAYFGSFYTKVSRAINSLIDSFPYAMLANTNGSANTVFGYIDNQLGRTSVFNIPLSAVSNQGNVIYASGVTDLNTTTLFKDFGLYGLQFSGTANTQTYNIIDYSYTTGTSGYMQFTIEGFLFTGATSATTDAIYIRPSTNIYSQYQRSISNLEYQLGFDGTFKVPDPDNDSVFRYETFTWPRTLDGFNINTYGDDFNTYKDSILEAARRTDEVKTSWMVRAIIPEQFIELDTDTQIYQKLISVYSEEFDDIKSYIDNLAFMHTVNYDRLESIPDKFMYKLSRLLSFDYHDAFSDSDIFEYLLEEDTDGKTLQDYNLELWRKMLINIVWLYKKKGTRDAISFIFKLMGAPECLVTLNEFVYKVQKINNTETDPNNPNEKVASDGYINFDASNFIFQEGGTERGNGQNYVNQWLPEFHLEKTVDNTKVHSGDTEIGTRDIMNSKEAQISLNSASAIECDVKDWYELGFSVWNWSTTGMTLSPFSSLAFSGMTVPFEWTPDPSSLSAIMPSNISALTISQWVDYIYASNVNPTNRKTVNGYPNHGSIYFSLKKIYMTYMLWTNSQESNRLTFEKLERLLELLERNFFKYILDFVPATTILETTATVYKNTVFERQKFVYPEGINLGSEFQKALPDEIDKVLDGYSITADVNNNIQPELDSFTINNEVVNNIVAENAASTIVTDCKPPISIENFSFTIVSNFYPEEEIDSTTANEYYATTMNYTTGNTVVAFSGNKTIVADSTLQSILDIGSIGLDNIL